ncbi:hypothetical protein DMB92_05195, partial [Campylobacter sp. MIT 99-7217]|uniref:hypothetical protein n=1 Tax=Campylobacter sp. MIT 99-7217 TaxID=535091 RepID=UPI00115BAB16
MIDLIQTQTQSLQALQEDLRELVLNQKAFLQNQKELHSLEFKIKQLVSAKITENLSENSFDETRALELIKDEIAKLENLSLDQVNNLLQDELLKANQNTQSKLSALNESLALEMNANIQKAFESLELTAKLEEVKTHFKTLLNKELEANNEALEALETKLNELKSSLENLQNESLSLNKANELFLSKQESVNLMTWKGHIDTLKELKAIKKAKIGDTYSVADQNGANYVYDGTNWDEYASSQSLDRQEMNELINESVNGINEKLALKADTQNVESLKEKMQTSFEGFKAKLKDEIKDFVSEIRAKELINEKLSSFKAGIDEAELNQKLEPLKTELESKINENKESLK